VTMEECGSHAAVAASFGACKVDERSLLRDILGALEPDMLLIADRNFYSFQLWQQALATGADLLWRVTSSVTLPVIEALPDGSYRSVVINPKVTGSRRRTLIDQVRAGEQVPAGQAVAVRVVEYEVPDRDGGSLSFFPCKPRMTDANYSTPWVVVLGRGQPECSGLFSSHAFLFRTRLLSCWRCSAARGRAASSRPHRTGSDHGSW
jgi:hypothetical protein